MSVSGSASLALLGLLFLGMFAMGAATMEVPSSVFALAAAPVSYVMTVLWSAPQPRGRAGAYLALLVVSIELVLAAAWWLAVALRGVPWDAPG